MADLSLPVSPQGDALGADEGRSGCARVRAGTAGR